jgi:hypothetical protein
MQPAPMLLLVEIRVSVSAAIRWLRVLASAMLP